MGIQHLSRHDEDKGFRLIRQLREAGTLADRRLANVLARCTEEHPCRSAACIHCGRDFQRLAVGLIEQEIRIPARREFRGRMSASTIIPSTGCLAPNDLTPSACRRVVADVRAAFAACGLSTYALSLDVSFNEDPTSKVKPHWCSHVHGLHPNWVTPSVKEALKNRFPKSDLVCRPVWIDPLDHKQNGRLYVFKPDRVRRVARDEGCHPYRRALRPWQAVSLAHVEHELGFEYRLITNKIDNSAVNLTRDAFYQARDGP